MNRNILNIVKFTVNDQVGNEITPWEQAAVFYEDGSIKLVSVADAVRIANQENIKVSNSTPEKLEKYYDSYRNIPDFDGKKKEMTTTKEGKNSKKKMSKSQTSKKKGRGFLGRTVALGVGFCGGIVKSVYGKIEQLADWLTVNVVNRFQKREKKKTLKEKVINKAKSTKENAKEYVKTSVADRQKNKKGKVRSTKATKKRKRGLFKRLTAAATALTLALGLGSCASPEKEKNVQVEQTKLTQDELTGLNADALLQMLHSGEMSLEQVKEMLESGQIKNDALDKLSYEQLLQVTNSTVQQSEMTKVGKYLDYFNGTFAEKYLEANHPGVRGALTWEEVNAINLAYNEFSKEEIQDIFNGYEIKSADFTNSYKEATLQLMGAFVLETRDVPVHLDSLLNTDEGKAFYQKYHELFLRCKENTGQAQINAVNAFYQEINKDFPITEEVREVGISHSESRDDIEAYKLSITPMVAATEMMFQNLDIDHTLSDKAIAYFNDLGLCEFAQGEYERAEQIMLCSKNDESIPTYEQFMNAKVKELTNSNIYFVSDERRDVSQYDLFQKWVNGHFNLDENGKFVVGGSISQSVVVDTYSKSETTYYTETARTETSDRNKAVSMAGEDAVRRAEEEVNKRFEADNEAAKAQGEADAEKNRQEMQEEALKEADKIRDEIEKDDQDFQDKIDDANDQINENNKDQDTSNDNPVNEDDLGHDVDFDDEHSNDNGDLDNSVGDITTDGNGTGTDLPDPNESGDKFDQNQPDYSNQPEGTFTTGEENGQTFIEYEESVGETVNYSSAEQIADAIVEEMVNNPTAEDEVFVYTK